MASQRILICIAMLLSVIYECFAINCYNCSSLEVTACLNPKDYPPEVRESLINVVNCEAGVEVQPPGGFFCRKLVQKIFTNEEEQDKVKIRVVRGCGWVRPNQFSHMINKDCYRDKSVDHIEIACQCFGDRCNGAETDAVSATVMFLTLVVCLFYYR